MSLFMYIIIYAELIVLLYWKHTVCPQTHTRSKPSVLWLCDSYSVWQDSETPRLNIQQRLTRVTQMDFPPGMCGHLLWIQLSTPLLHVKVQWCLDVWWLWRLQRSFVFIPVFMIPLSNLFCGVFYCVTGHSGLYKLFMLLRIHHVFADIRKWLKELL